MILEKRRQAASASSVEDEKVEEEEKRPQPASRGNLKQMIAAKRAAMAATAANKGSSAAVSQPVVTVESAEAASGQADEKTFQGGFFCVKSPIRPSTAATISNENTPVRAPATSKSTGGDRLRRSVLTESARRVSGLVSPYVSNMAKRSLTSSAPTSPNTNDNKVRRASLFDDMEELEERPGQAGGEEEEGVMEKKEELQQQMELVDPVCPLSSPVTKTYSKLGGSPAAEQQRRDLFDRLITSTSPKSAESPGQKKVVVGVEENYLQPSTPPAIAEFLPMSAQRGSTSSEEEEVERMVESPPKPLLKSARSTGGRRTKSKVSFTPLLDAESGQGSSSVVGTPHPLRRQKDMLDVDDTTTPRLRPRISLLPGMEQSPASDTVMQEDFISFESPSTSGTPSRRSVRNKIMQ